MMSIFHSRIFFFILVVLSLASMRLLIAPMNADSGVFYYVGQLISNGGVPYLDVWDHKGPILYILNFLFGWVGYPGLLVAEILLLFSAIYFLFKSTNFFENDFFYIVLISFVLSYMHFSEFGNYTETWSIIFQIVAYSIIFRKMSFGIRYSNQDLIFLGALSAIIFLIRPNNVIGVVFAIYLSGALNKVKNLLLLIFGFLIVGIPISVWLISNEAFYAFIDQYFLYNFLYSTESTTIKDALILPAEQLLKTPIFQILLLSLSLLILLQNKEIQKVNVLKFFIVIFIIDLLFSHLSMRPYLHYNITYLPSMLIVVITLLRVLDKELNISSVFKKNLAVVLISLPSLAYTSWVLARDTKISYNQISYTNTKSGAWKISKEINKQIASGESIYVYGFGGTRFLNYLNIRSSNKYTYNYPFYRKEYISNDKADKLINEIFAKNKYILDVSGSLCSKAEKTSFDVSFCSQLEEKYKLVMNSSPVVDLYTGMPVLLWKLKI